MSPWAFCKRASLRMQIWHGVKNYSNEHLMSAWRRESMFTDTCWDLRSHVYILLSLFSLMFFNTFDIYVTYVVKFAYHVKANGQYWRTVNASYRLHLRTFCTNSKRCNLLQLKRAYLKKVFITERHLCWHVRISFLCCLHKQSLIHPSLCVFVRPSVCLYIRKSVCSPVSSSLSCLSHFNLLVCLNKQHIYSF